MLEPWALEHQSAKKNLAWYAYQRWILQSASLLHATADMEARQLRDLGLTAPIAVIPNGVPLPGDWKQSAADGPTRQALFLSRLHPKKGLLNLVDAWAEVAPADWRLIIAGPDENNHRQKVEQRVETRGLTDAVDFPGPIDDADKWDLYRESDLFVLPTFSENFGVVVAEALASGVPAITTTGAPWQVLEEKRCGWWIEPEVDALADALRDATTRSDAERLAMGRRGRALVRDRFAWPSIAERLLEAYRWILGEGPKPGFVWAG
jgi:glycosyltransferase involved in cell wall biosynthesis